MTNTPHSTLSDALTSTIKLIDCSPDRCLGECAAPDAHTPAHQRWRELQTLIHQVESLEAENAELRRNSGGCDRYTELRARFIRSLESVSFWRSRYEKLRAHIDAGAGL